MALMGMLMLCFHFETRVDVVEFQVQTQEDRDRYIRDYEAREGIILDPNEIEKNEGLRSIAKLMLNSFW